jgi:meiotically up-regulated gene 157 (Mug157) protein
MTMASIATAVIPLPRLAGATSPVIGRPPPAARAFRSPTVERAISQLQSELGSSGIAAKLGQMVEQCLPNTLDTTVVFEERAGRPDTFVITGDIHAMWLRDSTAQVWPYLRFASQDPQLRQLLRGVVERQTRCVLIDPYANAFNREAVPSPEHAGDETDMRPGVFERKWELDSICSVIRLADGYWRSTGDTTPFGREWREAARLIVRTMREQQRKSGPGPYRFQRRTSWNPDSVPGNGYGNPLRAVGLIVSLFRPSDDAAIFPFLIPANMYAVVMLGRLASLHEALGSPASLANECRDLAGEVSAALRGYALLSHPRHGSIYGYEVDGFGNCLFMDDANVPSLLSLPYLGWCAKNDPAYRRTRSFVLGPDNPWFHEGSAAHGIGSPHTPGKRIWPISIIMRGLTTDSELEIAQCLRTLARTDAGTGFMHEAFDADRPADFSRPWFAWANSLFGEFMLEVAHRHPGAFRLLG